MLKLLAEKEKNIDVEDMELNIDKKLYAVDVFKIIEEKYKENDIYYIMGSDNYEKMPKWKEYDYIIEKYKYIVLEREENIISSTKIRNMIKNKDKKVLEILDKDVYNYIKKNKLYKE
jgi:nicotinate-nucleotide adenylyltransferase